MGFWDRNVENSFDSLFDMNRDGVLDSVEHGFQLDFLTRQMDEDERREVLEEAGYDPDDFDDDF